MTLGIAYSITAFFAILFLNRKFARKQLKVYKNLKTHTSPPPTHKAQPESRDHTPCPSL